MATTSQSLDTSVRVSILENQVDQMHASVDKLEIKLDQNYATLHSRISDMRDDLRSDIDHKHEKVMEKLDEQSRSSSAQHAAIAKQVQNFEKWRWMIMGAAVVIGYVLAHIKLEKFF